MIALAARSAWGLYRLFTATDPHALEFPDEIQYWDMARSLWAGDGLRDELGFRATRMPLYPALLAPLTALDYGVPLAKALHWIIGAAGAALTLLMGTRLFDRRVGCVAGLIVAIDPFLVFFSSLLLTETLFITLLAGLWWYAATWLIHRDPTDTIPARRWMVLGVAGALTVYARESTLGLVVLLTAFLLFVVGIRRRTMLGAVMTLSIVVASLFPWALRNYAVTGSFTFLTHRGGISLYDGVRPGATGASDLGHIKAMDAVRGLDEVAWNDYFMTESQKAIIDDPMRIIRLAGVKLARLWNPVPNVETYRSRGVRIIAAAWTLPIFVLAILGGVLLVIRRKSFGGYHTLFLILPAVYLSALHMLFIGSVRYRLGAMPMMGVLAACAIACLIWGDGANRTDRENPVDDRTKPNPS